MNTNSKNLAEAINKAIRIVRDTAIEDRPSLDDWFDVGEAYTVNVSGNEYITGAPVDGAWVGVYEYLPVGGDLTDKCLISFVVTKELLGEAQD